MPQRGMLTADPGNNSELLPMGARSTQSNRNPISLNVHAPSYPSNVPRDVVKVRRGHLGAIIEQPVRQIRGDAMLASL